MSTETKAVQHTPGPWCKGFRADSHYDGEDKNGRPKEHLHTVWQAIESSDGKRIATTGIYVQGQNQKAWRIPAEESEANARLIAAAPELLEALEAIDAFWGNSDGYPICSAPVHPGAYLTPEDKPIRDVIRGAIRKAKGLGIGSVLAKGEK